MADTPLREMGGELYVASTLPIVKGIDAKRIILNIVMFLLSMLKEF